MVSAARELLGEGGLGHTTVQNVLERSGVGAGSFYARFDGREALMGYLAQGFLSETEIAWLAFLNPDRWERADVPGLVTAFIRVLVAWSHENVRPLRAYLRYGIEEDGGRTLIRMTEVDNRIADRLVELIEPRAEEIGHPDPSLAVHLATLQLFATLRSRVIFTDSERDDGITDKTLVRELSRAFLGYIEAGSRPARQRDSGPEKAQ